MAKPKLTIIGLGLTGISLGLALRQEENSFEIVGHDRRSERSALAKKLGAIDRSEWNLFRSYEQADMIVLAVPVSALPELMDQIKEDLKPGCLILCLASTMQLTLALAEQILPREVHFLVGHPILSGVGGSLEERADLFQDAVFCLVPGVQTDPEAVEVASNLVSRLGAKALFIDAAEHDGIMIGVEQLPKLLAAALIRLNVDSSGWRDARKLAGRRFAQSTEIGDSAAQLSGTLQANRQNLLHWLKRLQDELSEWERLLESGSTDELLPLAEQAIAERNAWERDAFLKEWSDTPVTKPTSGDPGMLRQMFLGNMFGRRDRDRR